jgi:arginase
VGEWETGLGRGLALANVILVGARDLDPPEQARIDSGQIRLVPVGEGLGARLTQALGGRRVYVHLDCDVMDEGLVATKYQVSDGLIPRLTDQDPCAQSRRPSDMIRQSCSTSLFQASQQWSTISS